MSTFVWSDHYTYCRPTEGERILAYRYKGLLPGQGRWDNPDWTGPCLSCKRYRIKLASPMCSRNGGHMNEKEVWVIICEDCAKLRHEPPAKVIP